MVSNNEKDLLVYIEIEQFSNQKYEFNKKLDTLELDRVLPYPYFYPYAYGFIPNTIAKDGDELDILIITTDNVKKDNYYKVSIIGVLVMEDEKGMDEKILCVLEKDADVIKNTSDLSDEVLGNIKWFFKNYKSKTEGKWSKVFGFENKKRAIQLYRNSLIK
jgi:inorganic pyrophosphatase